MTALASDQPTAIRPSTRTKVGLVLCGLLGLVDIFSLALIGQAKDGEPGPPAAVLVVGAVLGVITLAGVVMGWRTGSRTAFRIVAAARILSALTSVPAFFVEDVSGGFVAGAGAGIIVTLVAVWLLLSGPSRSHA